MCGQLEQHIHCWQIAGLCRIETSCHRLWRPQAPLTCSAHTLGQKAASFAMASNLVGRAPLAVCTSELCRSMPKRSCQTPGFEHVVLRRQPVSLRILQVGNVRISAPETAILASLQRRDIGCFFRVRIGRSFCGASGAKLVLCIGIVSKL